MVKGLKDEILHCVQDDGWGVGSALGKSLKRYPG